MAINNEENEQSWFSRIVSLNPVLIRGVLVSVAALLTAILGKTIIENDTIETIIDVFVSISALVTALWARGKVIAENKVISWNPEPVRQPGTVVPGLAVVPNAEERADDLIHSAKHSVSQVSARKAA